MKTEIFNKLTPYEQYLIQAKKDYMRVPSRTFSVIAEIYREHFGKPLTAREMSFGRCQLKVLKRLDEDYCKFKESPYYKGLIKEKEEETNAESKGTAD